MNFFLLTCSKSSKSQLQRPASHIAWWLWIYHNFIYILFQKGFHVINNFFQFSLKSILCNFIFIFSLLVLFLSPAKWHHANFLQLFNLYISLMSPTKFAQSIYFHDFSSSSLLLYFFFNFCFWANWHIYEWVVVWRSYCWMFNTLNARDSTSCNLISRTAKLDSGECEIYGNAMLVLLLNVATLYFNVQSIIRERLLVPAWTNFFCAFSKSIHI